VEIQSPKAYQKNAKLDANRLYNDIPEEKNKPNRMKCSVGMKTNALGTLP